MERELLNLWEAIKPGLLAVLYTCAGSIVLSLVGAVMARVLGGIEKLREKLDENAYFRAARADDWIFDRISEVVNATYLEYVKEIKEANEDGKLTLREAANARNTALAYFMNSLTKIEYGELVALLGDDFQRIVLGRIELGVAAAKANAREAPMEHWELKIPEGWASANVLVGDDDDAPGPDDE